MAGKVLALHYKPRKGEYLEAHELSLVADKGIVGDRYFGNGSRQVLLHASDVLSELGYDSGDLREQITVDLPGLHALEPGTRLRIGSVEAEIEQHCAPCAGMGQKLGEDPEEFKERTDRRRGMFVFIRSDGVVRVGDEVAIVGV